jgi:ATP-dependent helicase IRC3
VELRPYQKNCIDAILAAKAEGIKRQLAVLATGLGKSLLFSNLPNHMQPGKRMLMVVHTKELVAQGAEHIRRWNPDLSVGIEMADEIATDEDIIVASVQTIGRAATSRRGKFDPADFEWLVVDECHRSIAQTYQNVFEHFGVFQPGSGCNLLGLTATPERGDSRAMGEVYEKIVFNYGLREGITDGWLSDVRGFRITTTTDISGVSTTGGDLDQGELEQVINTPERNDLIAKEFISCAWPRQTIGFTTSVQHSKDLAFAFQKAGIPAEAIWGSDPERSRKLKDHRSGKLMALFCAQLLVEGHDDANIACVIMGRPTKSSTFYRQAVGRGTRLGPGVTNLESLSRLGLLRPTDKRDCLILDVCDATGRHSLVSLPTLFGLGPKLDLKGKSATKTLIEIEEAAKQNPGIDLSRLEDATKLKSYVEEVGLWTVKFSEETAPFSKLQWQTAPQGNFVLLLPGKAEQLVVGENLLGRWSVWGQAGGVGVDEPYYASLQEALQAAEQIVAGLGSRAVSYLRKDSKWRAGKVTVPQRDLLIKWKVPMHVIEGMNSGSAGAYITKKIKEWQKRG